MATSGEKRWPPAGNFLAVVGEIQMAIDTHRPVRHRAAGALRRALDIHSDRWRPGHEQHRGACATPRRNVAENELRNPDRPRQPRRRAAPHNPGNLPPAAPPPAHLPHQRDHRPSTRTAGPHTASGLIPRIRPGERLLALLGDAASRSRRHGDLFRSCLHSSSYKPGLDWA